MAKARIIIKRRKAVRNIKKITKVMQMIATSRYQKAYKRAVGTKPYVKKIGELLASVVQAVRASGKNVEHPLLKEPAPGVGKTAVLVLSSNARAGGGVQRERASACECDAEGIGSARGIAGVVCFGEEGDRVF